MKLWHRLTAPWRRRQVRREDLARWDRTEEQVLELADDLKAFREEQTVPLRLPSLHEPDDEPVEEYVGKHRRREIGAGWGVPYLPAWHSIDTHELNRYVATWAADLGEPVRPVRGQVVFEEVRA